MFGFGNMLKEYLEYHKISQTDFANSLGITQKHMNSILNENADISVDLMLAISLITDIDASLIMFAENRKRISNYLNHKFVTEENLKNYMKQFCLKEMEDRNWIKLKDRESYVQIAMDLFEYLDVKNFDVMDTYFNNKILYKKKNDADRTKIMLWMKHCDKLITDQNVLEYKSENLVPLLEELKLERNKVFNCDKLIEIFNKYGIYLVIEDALKGTKIRGCVSVKGTNPAIYMTKYLKEKSSFYFALYHEIGHIKTDYNKAKSKIIVDEESGENFEEEKADLFAKKCMIPESIWGKIVHSSFKEAEEICKDENIPLCFLYSRLAKENLIKYSSREYQNHRESI